MRSALLRYFLISSLSLPPCWAQISESCKAVLITRLAKTTADQLQLANQKTVAAEKASAIASAETVFRQALTSATTVGACIGGTGEKQFAGILELRRVDKQVGPSSGTSGSTNLVPSGSVPALLGLAVEYGGLTETFSGTTVTFRTTPAKLIGAMTKVYGTDIPPPNDSTLTALQRVSLATSFDSSRTSGASTNSGTQLQANYAQLSQASARVLLFNDRDPLAVKNWQKIWKLATGEQSLAVANTAKDLLSPLTQMPEYDTAGDTAMAAFEANKANPNQDALQNALITYLTTLQQLAAKVPNWQQRVSAYLAARAALYQTNTDLYRQIVKAPSLSLEYDFTRPPVVTAPATTASVTTTPVATSPDLSTISLVYVASMMNSDYTLNATANFFNQTQAGMSGNFRDFQIAGKWDIPVGRISSSISKGTLTISGLYENLHQKPLGVQLTINDTAVNKPGNMGIFQIKYSIPIGDSGVQIPISFTASNRTELVKEKDVRGNVGITFDLDKLLASK
jgi:hypothetical protein